MIVQQGRIVTFHYTLTNQEGEQLESTLEKEPMSYLHGANNIISGLENAMSGRAAGDEFQVTVEPAQAYGEKNEANIQRIPAKRFKNKKKLQPGQLLTVQTNQGPVQVTVIKVGRFIVDVDANHPLAGQTLTFDVELTGVRDASEEEMDHGHVHGPGGIDH